MPTYKVSFMDGSAVFVSAPDVEQAKRKARAGRVNRGGPGFQPKATVTSATKESDSNDPGAGGIR
jgi:hypothetical protein